MKKMNSNRIPETDYYLYGVDNEVMLGETNLPMYIQLLEPILNYMIWLSLWKDKVDRSTFSTKETQRNICFLNVTRKIINGYWNSKIKTDDGLLIPNDEEAEYTQDIYIYKELPVIARKTIQGGDICINKETFQNKVEVMIMIHDGKIYLGNERPSEDGLLEIHSIDVKIEDWRDMFCLNYCDCSTTHKTQGETITENFSIWDWNKMSTTWKCRLGDTQLSAEPKIQTKFHSPTWKDWEALALPPTLKWTFGTKFKDRKGMLWDQSLRVNQKSHIFMGNTKLSCLWLYAEQEIICASSCQDCWKQ